MILSPFSLLTFLLRRISSRSELTTVALEAASKLFCRLGCQLYRRLQQFNLGTAGTKLLLKLFHFFSFFMPKIPSMTRAPHGAKKRRQKPPVRTPYSTAKFFELIITTMYSEALHYISKMRYLMSIKNNQARLGLIEFLPSVLLILEKVRYDKFDVETL